VTLKGTYLAEKLRALSSPNIIEARGRGLMWGLELKQNAGSLLSSLLQKGLLILADGPEGKVLSFTPPFTISEEEIDFAIQEVEQLI
jgi:acetylornithine/succinyldiaminopimelate/putrescine aminotransferase